MEKKQDNNMDMKAMGRVMEQMSAQEKKNKLKKFQHLNQYMKKNQILFTGSSLMEHFPIEELRIAFDIEPIIYNRGIGGFTTDEFLEHMDVMLLEPCASKIFINIGTNDISERFGADGAWLSRLITNYEKILSTLKEKQPDCQVYVMAYYPANMDVIGESEWGPFVFGTRTPENMKKANDAVCSLAQKYNYQFINVNDGLTDTDGNLKREYTTDGVHMIPDAYVQILHNLTPYLQ